MRPGNLLPIRLDCPKCEIEVPTIEIPGVKITDERRILLMVRICIFCEFRFEVRVRTPYEIKKFQIN